MPKTRPDLQRRASAGARQTSRARGRVALALGLWLALAHGAEAAGRAAAAATPSAPVNLQLQWRLVPLAAAADAGSVTVGTRRAAPETSGGTLRSASGAWAELRLDREQTHTWTQAAMQHGQGASASGGVVQGRVTRRSGERVALQAHWAGAGQPVQLQWQYERRGADDEGTSSTVGGPETGSQQQATQGTLWVPVGRWTPLATFGTAPTGDAAGSRTVSTQALRGNGARQLQVRITPLDPDEP